MRVLFVSGEMIAGDLPWRLQNEGCEVKLFIEHPEQQEVLQGFVTRVRDWKTELSWVGKDGLIVFDDVGYGVVQDTLRKEGYTVFGGSAGGDQLESDRSFCNEVFAQCGLTTVPVVNFSTPAEAKRYVFDHPGAWVIKQSTHQSALNYVGWSSDGADALAMLEHYEKTGIQNITLQKRIEGVEIGIARYFNGTDWVGPIEFNVEHKSLFPGDIGPKTGEMGTLMWYGADEKNPLYQATLARLQPHLQLIGYRGDVDINVFVNEQEIFPIEITTRLGCPSTHMHTSLHISPWHEFLRAVARGEKYDLKYRDGYGVVLTLGLPPFPYEGVIASAYLSEGLPVFFENLSDQEWKQIHFEGVKRIVESEEVSYVVSHSIGYTIFVSSVGPTVGKAREQALALARKVHIPKIFYRNDIGVEFEARGFPSLRRWGWL